MKQKPDYVLGSLELAMMPKKEILKWEDEGVQIRAGEYVIAPGEGPEGWDLYYPGVRRHFVDFEDAKLAAEVHYASSKL